MKMTEAQLKKNVVAANANSRHLTVGLRYEKHELSLVYRVNGQSITTWDGTLREQAAAVSMFNYVASVTREDGVKA